jgi:hypothetical protein
MERGSNGFLSALIRQIRVIRVPYFLQKSILLSNGLSIKRNLTQ